jgi:D-arabinose 1-dehydrogenase-like Zn-dependent alcohol dehydrogenase
MKLHLYAVSSAVSVEALTRLALTGIGGAPVRAIEVAKLTALVSTALSDGMLETRDALLHHAVIEHAMETANLLPARHSAAFSLEVLTAHLTQHREAYEGLLERNGDALEFGVRVELAGLPVALAPRDSGTAYLQARHAQFSLNASRHAELEGIAAAMESRLAPVTLEVKRDYPSEGLYRGSFLVCRADLEAAAHIGAEAAHDLRCARGSWHGPFPPYSFAVLP